MYLFSDFTTTTEQSPTDEFLGDLSLVSPVQAGGSGAASRAEGRVYLTESGLLKLHDFVYNGDSDADFWVGTRGKTKHRWIDR